MQNKKNVSDTAGENVNWYNHFEQVWLHLEKLKTCHPRAWLVPSCVYTRDRNT